MLDDKSITSTEVGEVFRFYQENPTIAAQDLLELPYGLPWHQRLALKISWNKQDTINVMSRGSGKTWYNAMDCILPAMLFPNERIGIFGPSFRQAKFVSDEICRLYDKSKIMREFCKRRPMANPDKWYLEFKNGAVIESMPLGCIVENSLLLTASGVRTMGEINPHRARSCDHLDVWSNGKFRSLDYVHYNEKMPTKKITTKRGYSIEGTPDHKIKILNENCEIVWKEFKDLSPGDAVLIDRGTKNHTPTFFATMEEAYFLGIMIGDGSWCGKCLKLGTSDTELIDSMRKVYPNLGVYKSNEPARKKEYFCCEVAGGTDAVGRFLEYWDMPVLKTINKRIPKKLLSAPTESIAACIRGLFDTDGTVQMGQKGSSATFCNTSEHLVNQVQILLLNFGIVSTKRNRGIRKSQFCGKTIQGRSDVYELSITGRDLEKFAVCIGFGLTRKQNKLKDILAKRKKYQCFDYIPYAKDLVAEFKKHNKIKKGQKKSDSKRFNRRRLVRRSEFNFIDVLEFIKQFENVEDDLIGKLKTVVNLDYYFDYVVDVSSGMAETYDIHVPDGNEYFANGFFSHNTGGARIRGARYHRLKVDEFAQVPQGIFDIVIQGMRATNKDPMENVMRVSMRKLMIEKGLMEEEDLDAEPKNKMTVSSTEFYRFNHLFKMQESFENDIKDPKNASLHPVILRDRTSGVKIMYNDTRALLMFDYLDPPEGFMNMGAIEENKKNMSESRFEMEYKSISPADSDGYFRRSKLEQARDHDQFTVETQGDPTCNYVMGLDPARKSDNFSMVIGKIYDGKCRIVRCSSYNNKSFVFVHNKIREAINAYNIVRICLDTGGGGLAIQDLLCDPTAAKGDKLIWDSFEDKDLLGREGLHILQMVKFSDDSIPKMGEQMKSNLDHGKLLYPCSPERYFFAHPKLEPAGLATLEDEYNEIELLLDETSSIVAQATRTGKIHLGLPGEMGEKREDDLFLAPRKDRWTASMLCNWAFHQVGSGERNEVQQKELCYGFAFKGRLRK